MGRTAVIVIGGSPPNAVAPGSLPADALVIAADSGLDHAEALGLEVALVVGDLDSVTSEALARAETHGTDVVRYPASKDATDTELAIEAAVAAGCDRIVGLSGGGDRLDHVLGAVLAFASPHLVGIDVELRWMAGTARVLRGPGVLEISGAPGDLLSLLPVHGAVGGITTEGLRYPLTDDTLPPGSSRGVSNVLLDRLASVSARSGTLLVVSPEPTSRGGSS
jgi:thiamine pyrophosphokinase